MKKILAIFTLLFTNQGFACDGSWLIGTDNYYSKNLDTNQSTFGHSMNAIQYLNIFKLNKTPVINQVIVNNGLGLSAPFNPNWSGDNVIQNNFGIATSWAGQGFFDWNPNGAQTQWNPTGLNLCLDSTCQSINFPYQANGWTRISVSRSLTGNYILLIFTPASSYPYTGTNAPGVFNIALGPNGFKNCAINTDFSPSGYNQGSCGS